MKSTTKLALALLAAVAIVPAGALANSGQGTDRANAARACKALKTTQPELFTQTYGTAANAHGKCVAAWAKTAAQARQAAAAACRAANAKPLGRCINARTVQRVNAELRALQNAAQTCKAIRNDMTAAAFRNAFGTNRNKANAFGKCVSTGASKGLDAGRVAATLTGAVGSGSFVAVLDAAKGQLCYSLRATGLTDITAAHIHVKPSGAAIVPLATPTTGAAGGCVPVDAALLRSILQTPGNYYVNVHTAASPAGAIAGDLRR
jgi:hypothetical protein